MAENEKTEKTELPQAGTPGTGRADCLDKPCVECPFSRSVPPGLTGGSHPLVYVGQAFGPFHLACHMAGTYEQKKPDVEEPRCAGASIFRGNCRVWDIIPMSEAVIKFLRVMEPDKDLVFASPEELLAHHMQISVVEARVLLTREGGPLMLVENELRKWQAKRAAGAKEAMLHRPPGG